MTLSPTQIAKFHRHGFVLVENFLSGDAVECLRHDCSFILNQAVGGDAHNAEMLSEMAAERFGCVFEPMAFLRCEWRDLYHTCPLDKEKWHNMRSESASGSQVASLISSNLFSQPLSEIFATRKEKLCLLNEQYIVKPASSSIENAFPFHQDGAFLGLEPQSLKFVSVWIPLDDVHEENGCLRFLPFPEAALALSLGAHYAASQQYPHTAEELGHILNTDFEAIQEIEVAVAAKAGSAIFISPWVYHRSGPNFSSQLRRAWMPQFSDGPISVPCAPETHIAVNSPIFGQ
jgi:hypothetical protein